MRNRIALVSFGLATCIGAAAPLYAQFEGVADFTITLHGEGGQSRPSSGKMYVSRAGYRSEWEMTVPGRARQGDASAAPRHVKFTIVGKKSDPDHIYTINDEKKTYSMTDLTDLKQIRESAPESEKQTYTVQKLGSDTIAGLSCQKASATSSKGMVFDVCLSKEWGASSDLIAAMTRSRRSNSPFTALKDAGLEGFPVRFGMRPRPDAEPTMVFELTRVEKKTPPASLFDVPPPGYRLVDNASRNLTPEQQKTLDDAKARMIENMTPEQRKAYEDAQRRHGQPTPQPTPQP
jgi:hypothetical protein